MKRVLEPEVMDSWSEAVEYDSMDFSEVNRAFAEEAIAVLSRSEAMVLDAGTGTARIPILIAKQKPGWQIIGIDLSENMLKIGERNIKAAAVSSQVELARVDAKKLPYIDGQFDLVISNSIVHHLGDPLPFLCEVKRVLKPGGGIFLRDLQRPKNEADRDRLVEEYAGDCNQHQKKLFRDSLQAAFTLEEVQEMMNQALHGDIKVYSSSDRHWTAKKIALG